MANETKAIDLKTRIKTHLNNLWPHMALQNFPEIPVSHGEIAAAGLFAGIDGRESYMVWVADYKALIKEVETHIRALKLQRRNPDINAHSHAQSEACWHADAATALIRMRRLGKVWSAAEARSNLDTAA